MSADGKHDGRFLVIGAGPVGLAVARALKAHGIATDQVDAGPEIGGNWHHGVYRSAHIISSRKTTEFADYPMPAEYPDFPSADQMLAYLQAYARHFGLADAVELGRKVVLVRPADADRWAVHFEHGEERRYKGVVVCNGHHWAKRWPEYAGRFAGELMHSKDYKAPAQLAGKRVLVIGGGNSACDLAAEAARVAARAHVSMRRGYWILPKSVFGMPVVDLMGLGPIPVWIQRLVLRSILAVVVGRYERYGLKKPDHKIFEHHPTVNSELLYYLRQGSLVAKPDVARFERDTVEFVDGRRQSYDLVVCATGYHQSFPFIAPGVFDVRGVVPQVHGGFCPAGYRHLYVFGWGQPRYGLGPQVTPAAELLARMIALQDELRFPLGDLIKASGDVPPPHNLMDPMKVLRAIRRGKRRLRLLKLVDRRLARSRAPAPHPAMPAPELARNRPLEVY